MSDPTVKFLRDLIAIDSVNPSLVPGGAGEKEVAGAVAAKMRAIGMDVEVMEVAPGRPNVVGVLEGRAPGKSLMFCGHTDTVSVEGMQSPFDPVERDGRLYGRGSGDMKGGVAAMIGAASAIAASGGLEAGKLIVAASEMKSIRELQVWIADHLERDLSVQVLAERVRMSVRNFERVFTRETACTPARYVAQMRVEAARRQLEDTDKSIEQIARSCGFLSSDLMRRAFVRSVGTTPGRYRNRLSSASSRHTSL